MLANESRQRLEWHRIVFGEDEKRRQMLRFLIVSWLSSKIRS